MNSVTDRTDIFTYLLAENKATGIIGKLSLGELQQQSMVVILLGVKL